MWEALDSSLFVHDLVLNNQLHDLPDGRIEASPHRLLLQSDHGTASLRHDSTRSLLDSEWMVHFGFQVSYRARSKRLLSDPGFLRFGFRRIPPPGKAVINCLKWSGFERPSGRDVKLVKMSISLIHSSKMKDLFSGW